MPLKFLKQACVNEKEKEKKSSTISLIFFLEVWAVLVGQSDESKLKYFDGWPNPHQRRQRKQIIVERLVRLVW